MSRSKRHVPVWGNTCAGSDKWSKSRANRRLRRIVQCEIGQMADPDGFVLTILREVSDPWLFAKDGKRHHWTGPVDPKWMRK